MAAGIQELRVRGHGIREGTRVLIVEDEFLIALDLEDMLTRHGCRVIGPVGTVAAALALIENEPPDAALLDVNLRGEMVTPVAIALQQRGIPFVLSSAYDRLPVDAIPELRDVDRVPKPINERRLLRALARLTPQV